MQQKESPGIKRPRPVERALELIRDPDAGRFEDVVIDVFAYQFQNNEPYRHFCRHRGKGIEDVRSWEEIPVVPTAAFKEAVLTTAPARYTFITSGTSQGVEKRGKHHLPALDLYRASWNEPFRRHLLPDRDSIRILSLIPSVETLPNSSLSFMASAVVERYGASGSGFFVDGEGLHSDGLHLAIRKFVTTGEPALILGTALVLRAWLSELETTGERFVLPPGSRVMDTGGFKGRSATMTRAELVSLYERRLGIPPSQVVGEYGMTELCSQFYEPSLDSASSDRAGSEARVYRGPPWTRTRVLDPETLSPVPAGDPGLLAHWDLANAWTVCAVVTEDLGILAEDGFRLLGRAEGAELRGCSLMTEELLGGT
jgi:hypothetical protein